MAQRIDLQDNEAVTNAATVPLTSQDSESFLIIGTKKDMVIYPRQFSEGHVYVYRFHGSGKELEFTQKTKGGEAPTALLNFQGRLARGIGNMLYIYELGLKQLVRKAQADVASRLIVSLQTQDSRIVVGDVQQDLINLETRRLSIAGYWPPIDGYTRYHHKR